METSEMGRVVVEARVENAQDEWDVKKGDLAPEKARVVTIPDALVDTGATGLSLPTRFVRQLGLQKVRERMMRTAGGPRKATVYSAVRLKVQDRDCMLEVTEVDDDVPTLIGQIPLEWMDFVVDPRNQRLIGNPAHGGEWTWEAY
jgi:clan AA aspartic protease